MFYPILYAIIIKKSYTMYLIRLLEPTNININLESIDVSAINSMYDIFGYLNKETKSNFVAFDYMNSIPITPMVRKRLKSDKQNELYLKEFIEGNPLVINESKVKKKPIGDKPRWWRRLDEAFKLN